MVYWIFFAEDRREIGGVIHWVPTLLIFSVVVLGKFTDGGMWFIAFVTNFNCLWLVCCFGSVVGITVVFGYDGRNRFEFICHCF